MMSVQIKVVCYQQFQAGGESWFTAEAQRGLWPQPKCGES
jgi:hypothetical protein